MPELRTDRIFVAFGDNAFMPSNRLLEPNVHKFYTFVICPDCLSLIVEKYFVELVNGMNSKLYIFYLQTLRLSTWYAIQRYRFLFYFLTLDIANLIKI
jgi:hypothetical protein